MKLHFNGPRSVFKQVEAVLGPFPVPEVSYGSSITTTVRLNKVQFGEGYEQRSLDGINSTPLVFDVVFRNRSQRVIEEVVRFLKGDKVFYDRTPDEYFYMIPPAPFDDGILQTPRKFKCEEWKTTAEAHNNYTLTTQFKEVFEP
jgi:phage-related protein